MKVVPPSNKEILWRAVDMFLMRNQLMDAQYYTTLFTYFKQLMYVIGDEDNFKLLEKKIEDFEKFISDPYNPITLSQAEVYMFQNMDLLSGFEVNGQMITQQMMNEKLVEIKRWLMQLHSQYTSYIRFTVQVKMM